MTRILFFCAAFLLIFASSCTITHDLYVAKDNSGSVKYTIDMSQMMAMAGDEAGGDEEMSILSDPEFKSSIDELRQAEGVTDVQVEENTEKGIYTFGFSCKDVDLLNEAMGSSDMRMDGGEAPAEGYKYLEVTKKGKKVHFELPDAPADEAAEAEEGMGDMAGMDEMMRYVLNLRFERKIKKVKTHLEYSIDEATNTVKIDVPISAITDKEKKFEVDVRLK